MMYNIHNGGNWWQIPDFLYDGNSNVYLVSHRLQDIRKIKKDCQHCDLENESQGQGVEKRNLRHSAGKVQIHINDFFHNFS